jgi:hypothetical protein
MKSTPSIALRDDERLGSEGPNLDPQRVYFLDEVGTFLRVSRSTLERLRRVDALPIAELPSLDKRPRFSGAAILKFITEGGRLPVRGWRKSA